MSAMSHRSSSTLIIYFYIILAVLHYVMRGLVVARSCGTDFDDLQSKTISSSTVFEGRAVQVVRVAADIDRGLLRNDSNSIFVTFRVNQVFKGHLDVKNPDSESVRYKNVTVGLFEDITNTNSNPRTLDSASLCIGHVDLGRRYIVFVGDRTDISVSGRTRDIYWNTGLPERATNESIRTVKKSSCRKCGRKPKARLIVNGNSNRTTLTTKEPMKLSCKVSGKPRPRVTWYKDGEPLIVDERMKISGNERKLRISRLRKSDGGMYQCRAENIISLSSPSYAVWVDITEVTKPPAVTIPPAKGHAILCEKENQSYCLNGGVCYILTPLNVRFCECDINFQGGRCQEKNTGFTALSSLQRTGIHLPPDLYRLLGLR